MNSKKKKKKYGNWTVFKVALSLKCPVVLVTEEKAMETSKSSFGFLWNEGGFCVQSIHVLVTVGR